MGKIQNGTLPYISSVIILLIANGAFISFSLHVISLFGDLSPLMEVITCLSWLLLHKTLIPPLFFRCNVFVQYHQIAMYPPKHTNYSRIEWANEMQRRRKNGKLPFTSKYPNGWFGIMRSCDLSKGQVKPMNILDKNLAVFRGQDGVAYVIDAYCPHLGANMSVLGKVIKNCLQCPFHGWTFRGEDGACVDIPYLKSTAANYPKQAKVDSYNVMERNGTIFLWYHAENKEPTWFIEPIEGFEDYYEGGCMTHTVNCHISEIPENGADFAHFFMLHEDNTLAGGDMRVTKSKLGRIMTHKWTPKNWHVGEETEKHMIKFQLFLDSFIGETSVKLPGFDSAKVDVCQIGPAYVALKMKMGRFFQGYYIQTIVPEEQFMQRVTHKIIARPWNQLPLVKLYLYSERFQFERDVSMWNHKSYKSNPVLVKDDGPIRKYRSWYQQFYSTVTDNNEEETGSDSDRRDKRDELVIFNGAPVKESLNVKNLDW